MAARKKGTGKGASDAEASRATAVILEQMHAQFKAFGEGLSTLREQMDRRFDQVDRRFEQMDRRFEQMDRRFEQIDLRFAQVDVRFDQMDQRFDRMDVRLGRVEQDLSLVKAAVDRKVDRDEVGGIVERAIARAVDR